MSKPLPIQMYPNYDEMLDHSVGIRKHLYKLLPIPLHTFYPLRQEIYLFFVRMLSLRTKRHYRNHKGFFVNIGAGSNNKQGWVNIDIVRIPGIDCFYDCRKSLPFPDYSVRGIYCEHFIEHLDYTEEVPLFLSECYRVLQAGGVIRIITPDAEKYLNASSQDNWDALCNIRPLEQGHVDHYYGCQYRTKMELINMVFRQGYHHKYAYDFETLRFILLRYGFSRVQKQEFSQTLLKELNIDQAERATESLYVDAIR